MSGPYHVHIDQKLTVKVLHKEVYCVQLKRQAYFFIKASFKTLILTR